jgi:uncharacterized membrane protein YjjB (DUF3815 family)
VSPLEPLWAGLATAGFAVLFNLRGRDAPIAAAVGALGWAVAAPLAAATGSTPMADFAAAAAVGLASEIVAVLRRRPASVYICCGIIPLVPGAGMYYTMMQYAKGDALEAQATGMATLAAAGAIAAGIAVSGALARLLSLRRIAARTGLARVTGLSKSPTSRGP